MQSQNYERETRRIQWLGCGLLVAATAVLCLGILNIALAERERLLLAALTLAAAIVLVLVCLCVWLWIVHPLNRIRTGFPAFSAAEMDGSQISEEEIDALTRNAGPVGSLVQIVTHNTHSDSKAKALNAEVALYALQSEINPHFLYNALEVIRNYAMNYGVNEISEMTLALARIFRYSISRPGEVATFSDEINNIKNYMKIQQYRFPDRFAIEFDLDEADEHIMKCSLPVLTLQPIVENALNHGLENLMRQGVITLRAVASDKNLIVIITDNGVGMSPEKLEGIRACLKSGFTRQNSLPGRQLDRKTGVSLNNVNNRLKIYFGNEYGLSITSCVGKFTTVEMVVPRILAV